MTARLKNRVIIDRAKEHGAIVKTVSRRYHEIVEFGIDSADTSSFMLSH